MIGGIIGLLILLLVGSMLRGAAEGWREARDNSPGWTEPEWIRRMTDHSPATEAWREARRARRRALFRPRLWVATYGVARPAFALLLTALPIALAVTFWVGAR